MLLNVDSGPRVGLKCYFCAAQSRVGAASGCENALFCVVQSRLGVEGGSETAFCVLLKLDWGWRVGAFVYCLK